MTNDRPVRESEDNAPNPIEKAIGDYLDQLNSGKAIGPKEVLEENPLFGEHIIATVESFVDLDSVGESPEPLGTLGDYTLRRQIRDSRRGGGGPSAVFPGGSLASWPDHPPSEGEGFFP